MMEHLYRFRSVDRLIRKHELERQEIYLASPSQLNDPMEGYRDFVYIGDSVLWTNLLRHYVLCLVEAVFRAQILDSEEWQLTTNATATEAGIPTDTYRELYGNTWKRVVMADTIAGALKALSSAGAKLGRHTVQFILAAIHVPALVAMHETFQERGLGGILRQSFTPPPPSEALHSLAGPLSEVSLGVSDALGEVSCTLRARWTSSPRSLSRSQIHNAVGVAGTDASGPEWACGSRSPSICPPAAATVRGPSPTTALSPQVCRANQRSAVFTSAFGTMPKERKRAARGRSAVIPG